MTAHSLGTRLRSERESRGFTLVQISESTKIPVGLLAALERNDLSRWPKAFYGRAFFKSYVAALGLDPDPLVLEFSGLIQDDSAPAPTQTDGPSAETEIASPAPLALSWAGPSIASRLARSVGMALLEVTAVAVLGATIAWGSGLRWLEAIGIVALVYLPGSRIAAERIPWWSAARGRASASALSSFVIRTSSATGRGTAVLGRRARLLSGRAFAGGSYTFWKGVRAVAEHAELLATRHLNRTRE